MLKCLNAKINRGFTMLEIQGSQPLSKNPKAKPPNGLTLSVTKFNGKFLTGFTILEVMVAIFVLTVGVLAAFNVAQNITTYSKVNSSRLTATYLAQEGIELVRNQRDTNWLGGDDWDTNKGNLIGAAWPSPGIPRFTRVITIFDNGSYIYISVDVSWEERGATHSVTNATELYNWLY